MSSGNVKKFSKNKGYESISRNMVQDIKNLSLQAIGLLSHLISLPDDFEIFKTVLYKRFSKNGRRSIVRAWDELVENNYIVQFRKKDDRGNWEYIYYFSQEKFNEDDIKLIESKEKTKSWDGKRDKNSEDFPDNPLYILNNSETVNGNRQIYISNNKDLLINKDIDKDIDTIDTNSDDFKIDAFYKNYEYIPKKIADMLRAFFGNNINKADKYYKKIIIAKRKAEQETKTVIQIENDSILEDVIIQSFSRAIRLIEGGKGSIENPGGYLYKSIKKALINEINARHRQETLENSEIYFDWINNE